METTTLVMVLAAAVVIMAILGYLAGRKLSSQTDNGTDRRMLEDKLNELRLLADERGQSLERMAEDVKKLTAERDVQCNRAENAERQVQQERVRQETLKREYTESLQTQMAEWKRVYESQLDEVRKSHVRQMETLRQMNQEQVSRQAELIREQMKATS
ncbi:MAG: hypothetical protein ACI3X4_08805, partial [Bacteroidaceae bacterium]